MRVAFYAYFELRRELDAGGVQRVAKLLLPRLAARSISITVVCPRGSEPDALPGIEVLPLLEQLDGAPFDPACWARDAESMRAAAAGADLAWSFDRPLPGPVAPPWLLTLHTLTYERPLRALLDVGWDGLAVPSRWLAETAGAIAGPSCWEGDPPPIELIANGIDPALTSQGEGEGIARNRLRAQLGLPEDARCLVFPHRPDPDKGVDTAIAALARLLAVDSRFRLLVPRGPDAHTTSEEALRAVARAADVGDALVHHPWVPSRDLRAYLGLAEASLTLSRLPEGFGLAPVEAIAAGVPAISTDSGGLGDLLPRGHGLTIVPRDDPQAVAAAVLTPPPLADLALGRKLVAQRYDIETMADRYADLLTRVTKREARYRPTAGGPGAASPLPGHAADS